MKFFILSTLLIGLVAAQNGMRDSRCPMQDGNFVTRLPHPTDCRLFLQCHQGATWESRCPDGLHWSVSSNSCETPERARCVRQNQPGPNWPNPPQNRPIPIPRPDRPDNRFDPHPWVEHPEYLDCPFYDRPGRDVFYPYHLNCANYYRCVDGRAVL